MMAAVVTDASAAYLQRQGLDTLADGAALTAADAGASGDEAYGDGLGADLHLDADAARAAVGRLPPPRRRLHPLPDEKAKYLMPRLSVQKYIARK